MSTSSLSIRPATPKDGEHFLSLIQALAQYEQLPGPDEAAQKRLLEDAFGPHPRFWVLLAEFETRIVGYAVLFETYSTFRARPKLYLEDLFVLPEYRGKRVGAELFLAVVKEAHQRNCTLLEWVVLDWNQSARDFYERFGAKHYPDWLTYGLDRDEIERLASS